METEGGKDGDDVIFGRNGEGEVEREGWMGPDKQEAAVTNRVTRLDSSWPYLATTTDGGVVSLLGCGMNAIL